MPQEDLDDLLGRVARTRWPDELDDAGWDYGVPGRYVRELADHWLHRFDWRAVERRLNAYPQYRTEIDGERIHFLHVRNADPAAPAIILTHGWPGSVLRTCRKWIRSPSISVRYCGYAFRRRSTARQSNSCSQWSANSRT